MDEFNENSSPELEKQKKVVQHAEKIFKTFKNYKPDHSEVVNFVKNTEHLEIFEFYSGNLVLDIFEFFHQGVTQTNQIDRETFMAFIRKLYSMFSEKHKKLTAAKIIDRWQLFEIDYSPYFAQVSPDFDQKLNRALQAIGGEEFDEELSDDIRWSLAISPPHSLHRILHFSVSSPSILPTIFSIFHKIPDLFFDRKLKIFHYEHEVQKEESLLEVVLRRIIRNAREQLTRKEQWENLEEMMVGLGDEGLIGQWALLNLVLCELVSDYTTPKISIDILSSVAWKILEKPDPNGNSWKFAVSRRQPPEAGLILTPTILERLLKFADDSEDVRRLLKVIGQKMEGEFDEETKEKLMTSLESDWKKEFAIATWFGKSIKIEKRKVPKPIFDRISEEKKEHFEEIEAENGENDEPVWNSLIDLGVFDAELAGEILEMLMTSSEAEDGVYHVERLLMNGGSQKLAERIFEKFPPANENCDELIQKIMEKIPKRSDDVIPTEESHCHVEVCALDEPLKPKVVWPTDPADPRCMQPLSRAQIQKYKEAQEAIKRGAAEWEERIVDKLRQKWKAEGVFDAPKPNWMAKYRHHLPIFDTESTCGSVGERSVRPMTQAERDRVRAVFQPTLDGAMTSQRSQRRKY